MKMLNIFIFICHGVSSVCLIIYLASLLSNTTVGFVGFSFLGIASVLSLIKMLIRKNVQKGLNHINDDSAKK